uniref:Corticotropin-releasing factor-binding protein n=1 Tax=Neogobius melanostomus TaxID=47308 RepID=A0A8C6WEP8_9GOBI
MERTFREQLFLLVLCLSVLKGDARYVENNEISQDDLYTVFNLDLKREMPDIPTELIYRRSLRCLDMIAVEGQFTFTAERPQLNCAAFFMAEPNEVISVEYDHVDIDCSGGDFITVFDGWVMKGEKFPSSLDHALPLFERYVDYCDSGSRKTLRSSQNVAMLFFRIHNTGSSFTVTIRKHINPFPCNVISHSPEGSYTMVIPLQQKNCSFSIIYPVEIKISEFSLGPYLFVCEQRTSPGCADAGDFVELLGGNTIDSSKLLPITDLCMSFTGPTQMKIGCENIVVRMVSSGRFINRVSFSYRLLNSQELQILKLNSIDDFCSTK